MSSNGKHHPPELLDAYLDGMLKGPRLADFESRLMSDSSLRAELDLQRRIDNALKNRFREMPFPELLLDRVLRPAKSEIQPKSIDSILTRPITIPRRWLAVAAVILIALCAYPLTKAVQSRAERARRPMDAVFYQQVNDGFNAGWKVDASSPEFGEFLRQRLGQGLRLRQPLPANMQIVGFSTASTRMSKNTVLVLARLSDVEIIVFIDRAANDGGQQLTHGCGLNRYRRVIGPLVLYEVSQLESAQLLDLFELQP